MESTARVVTVQYLPGYTSNRQQQPSSLSRKARLLECASGEVLWRDYSLTTVWPEVVKAFQVPTACRPSRHEKSDIQFQAGGKSQGTDDQGAIDETLFIVRDGLPYSGKYVD